MIAVEYIQKMQPMKEHFRTYKKEGTISILNKGQSFATNKKEHKIKQDSSLERWWGHSEEGARPAGDWKKRKMPNCQIEEEKE